MAKHFHAVLRLRLLGSRHGRIATPGSSRIVQPLNISPPLLDIRPQNSPIIGKQAIDFALHIRRLRPDPARTGKHLDLLAKLGQKLV